MPTLPMYHTPTEPDAWHRVTAPGGYEWWHFDAEDEAGETRVAARIYDGHAFDPAYVRAYRRYLRMPTRRTPPVPGDFPCAELAVYRGGKVLGRFEMRFPRGAFSGSAERVEVNVGPNRLVDDGGTLRLLMADDASGLRADLSFRPKITTTPLERVLLPRERLGSEHRWIMSCPLYDVEGSLGVGGERIDFRGRGYHDHRFGTGPIVTAANRWMSGRVLLRDAAVTFQLFAQNDRFRRRDESILVAASDAGVQEIAVGAVANWEAKADNHLRYPRDVTFGDRLRLRNGRVIDATEFGLRLTYDARVGGQGGSAHCEIVCPFCVGRGVGGRAIMRAFG